MIFRAVCSQVLLSLLVQQKWKRELDREFSWQQHYPQTLAIIPTVQLDRSNVMHIPSNILLSKTKTNPKLM